MVQLKLAFLLIVLSLAFVSAEDVEATKKDGVSSKWFGGLGYGLGYGWGYGLGYGMSYLGLGWLDSFWGLGSAYGYGMMPLYGGMGMYFKSVDSSSQQKRRSVLFASLEPRQDTGNQQAVQCKNAKGDALDFHALDCARAAQRLATEKSEKASCGSCALSLMNSKGALKADKINVSELQDTASKILQGCSNPKSVPTKPARGTDTSKMVALILSKGEGNQC